MISGIVNTGYNLGMGYDLQEFIYIAYHGMTRPCAATVERGMTCPMHYCWAVDVMEPQLLRLDRRSLHLSKLLGPGGYPGTRGVAFKQHNFLDSTDVVDSL